MNIQETYTKRDLIDALVVARSIDPSNRNIYVQEASNILKNNGSEKERLNQVVLKLAKQAFIDMEIKGQNTATASFIDIISQYQKPSKEYLN